MPPIEPPTAASSLPMPRWSSSSICAFTMSSMVIIGKSRAVRLAGGGVLRGRPGAPAAAADHVGADDEVLVGVESLAGTDHHVPPARALVVGAVQPGDVGVAGEGVGDEDGVVLALVQRAVGLVGERERRQRAAPFEGELLAGLVERHLPGADDAGVAGVVVVPHGDVADLLAGCGLLLGHGCGDSNERGRVAGERAAGRRRLRLRPAAPRPRCTPAQALASAWSMSATMSSSDSMPMLRRTKSSVTPATRAAPPAVSCECVVVAGWIDQRLRVADVGEVRQQLRALDEAPARVTAAGDPEADDRPVEPAVVVLAAPARASGGTGRPG